VTVAVTGRSCVPRRKERGSYTPRVRIGFVLPMEPREGARPGSAPPGIALAEQAEAIGLDSVWVYDHFFSSMPDERPRIPVHEAWTVVSAVAARTNRVEIGQLVMCTAYRPPGMLAKMAVTADAVSGGRLTLGVGAGWHTEEYGAFGYPFDDRVGRFEEVIAIIAPLLRGETVTVDGRYHSVDGAVLMPFDRRIPILIAAFRPRMLRLTARYADAWNAAWYGMPDEKLRTAIADMDAALEAEGRDPSMLRRTVGVDMREPETNEQDGGVLVDDLPRLVDAYEELGVDDVFLAFDPASERTLERVERALAGR
jgi:alkanesulfonate monooxygenase SsuD/methylene tetrahydromethanopterin reductase-like flavin-dependent oxidoreductase (luciferase family)